MPDAPWKPPLFPKQFEVFNEYCHYLLVSGSRKSSKSVAVGHKVLRHMWETDGARVALFSLTIKNAKDGGVWQDVTDIVLPPWLNSGMVGKTGLPLEYTTFDRNGTPGPKAEGTTRTLGFRIRNWHGTESEMKLFSLDNPDEIKGKLLSTRYSMIWFSELSNFKSPDVFRVGIQQLRMFNLNRHQQQWIADTNPAEEGEDSWIYKLFYLKDFKGVDISASLMSEIKKQIKVIEMFHSDNPSLDEFDVAMMKASYADDPGEYARIVNGLWVKGHGHVGKVFFDLWSDNLHVIPGAIDISTDTFGLYMGWDTGEINHAAVIIEERIFGGQVYWNVLEEIVTIADTVSIEEFTGLVMEKIEELETTYRKTFEFEHWSDTPAMNNFRSAEGTYDYLTINKASKGRIDLQGVHKPSGSVKQGINIMRTALRGKPQNGSDEILPRLFVGANCPITIEMFKELRRGTTKSEPVLNDRHKHVFDALRYVIYMRALEHAADENDEGEKTTGRKSGVTSVG